MAIIRAWLVAMNDSHLRQLTSQYIFFYSDVNECKVRNPCKNGATCVNSVGSYSCQCPGNYKGKHCDEGENLYFFLRNICLQLSYFVVISARFKELSFYSIDVDECISKKPCKNGAKCENTRGGYKCTCVGKWFTGKHCDQGRVIETFTDHINEGQMCANLLPKRNTLLLFKLVNILSFICKK